MRDRVREKRENEKRAPNLLQTVKETDAVRDHCCEIMDAVTFGFYYVHPRQKSGEEAAENSRELGF